MNQDAAASKRRRRASSRAAGPPSVAVGTPADALDPSEQPASSVDNRSESGPVDQEPPTQPDNGRRRTRRQRSQRRGGDSQGFQARSVMPPERPSQPRRITEPSSENGAEDQGADQPIAAHGLSAGARHGGARRSDRGLRGLEGSRSTQVSPTAAMRAREYAAPTAEDLAEAEREVRLVRRKYVPPTPLQASRRRGRHYDPAD